MRGSNTNKSILDAAARQWLDNETSMGNVARAYRQRKAGEQDRSSPPAPDKTRASAAVYSGSMSALDKGSGLFSDDSDDEEPASTLDKFAHLASLLNLSRKESSALGGDDFDNPLDMLSKLEEALEGVRGAQAAGGRSGSGGDEVDKAGEESISRARKEAERKEAERKAEEEARRKAAAAKRRTKLEEKRRKAAEEQAEQVMRKSEEMEAKRRREEEAEMRRRQEEERVKVTLFTAAAEGREKEVVALLEGMPDSSCPLRLRRDTGESLLHACVSRYPPDEATAGRLNTAAVLLELDEKKGCVVDMVTCRDDRGHALLHSIAEASDEAYLQLLLARKACMPQWKLDLNAVSQEGLTPLHHGARAAAPGVVKLLLENDAVISKASGSTPIDLIREEVEQAGNEGGEGMLSERQRRLRQVHQLLSQAVAQKEAAAAQRKREAVERKERKLQEKKEEAALEDTKKKSESVLRSAAEELEKKIKREMEAKAKSKQQKKDAKKKEEEKHEALRLLAAERLKEREKEKEREKKAVVVPQLAVRTVRTHAPPTAEVKKPAIASAPPIPPTIRAPAAPSEVINPEPIVVGEPLFESLKEDMMMQLVATAAGGAPTEVGSQASDTESEAEMQAAVSIVDTAQLELQLSLTEEAKVDEEIKPIVQPVKRPRQPALMLSRKEEGRRVHRESVQMAEEDEGMWVRMQDEAEARLLSARVELEAAEANLKLVLQRRGAQQAAVALAKAPSVRAAAVSEVSSPPSSEASLDTLNTSEAPSTSPSHIDNDVSVQSVGAPPPMTESEAESSPAEPAPTPAIDRTVEPLQVESEPVQMSVTQPGNEVSVVKAIEQKVHENVATDGVEMEAQPGATHESSPPVRKAKRSRGVKRGDGGATHDGERSTKLGSASIENVDERVGRDGRSGKGGNVVEWGKVDLAAPAVSEPGSGNRAVGADVQGQEVQGERGEGRNAGRQGKRRVSRRERDQEKRRKAAETSDVDTNATAAAAHVIELPSPAPNNATQTAPAVQEETTLSSIVGLMLGPLSRPPAGQRGGEGGDASLIDEGKRRRSRRRGGKGRGGRGRDSGERDAAQHNGVLTSADAVETNDMQQLVHDPPPYRQQQQQQEAAVNDAIGRDAAAEEKSNRRTAARRGQAKALNKAASEERGEQRKNHNDKKADAANGHVGGGGKGIENKEKTFNVSSKSNSDASSHVPRFNRVCKFFGLGSGCDRGLDCPYRHDQGARTLRRELV